MGRIEHPDGVISAARPAIVAGGAGQNASLHSQSVATLVTLGTISS